MCGIAGYIGQSKKPKMTYKLITSIFDYLELRGTDASGLWGTESKKDGRIIYHKEPVRSSEFIKGSFWQKLKKIKFDMLLIHARAASKGATHANNNANNHPFVSADCRIGMVHNGHLEEASFLKDKYEIKSDTDSEFLLRMYEHGLGQEADAVPPGIPDFVTHRMKGLSDIWSVVTGGAMAVAIGERIDDDNKCLILFHNEKRPLWVTDLRESLGQIFFFSSPDIWYRAITGDTELEELCWKEQKLIDVPVSQIWFFKIGREQPIVTSKDFFQFNVSVSDFSNDWEAGPWCPTKPAKECLTVVSRLNDDEEVIGKAKHKSLPMGRAVGKRVKCDDYDDCDRFEEPFMRNDHDSVCEEIKKLAEQVSTEATNYVLEGSMNETSYQDLMESLEQTKQDLKGTLALLGR